MARTGSDFLRLDTELPDDVRAVGDTLRRFLADKVTPVIGEHFEQATFPREVIPQLAELGVLGMHLRGYGCAGMSALAYGVACRELERCDSALRSFVSVQGSLAMWSIWRFGSEDHKQHWLPRMAAGEAIGCFGLSEPDYGSDPAGMRTKAVRDGDGYLLSGTKMWITNAPLAQVAVVWARLEGSVVGFLVELDRPGVRVREIEHKLSLRASTTGEIVLDECRIPETNRLPGAVGLGAPLAALNEARYGIVWGALGAAEACFDAVVDYAESRHQFGKPLGSFQITQLKLADMLTQLSAAQLLAYRLAVLKDAGQLEAAQVSLGKRHNVRVALEIARAARAIHGANGISLEYPVFRHMVNLESVLTYEGTEEIHALVLGETITGIPAYR